MSVRIGKVATFVDPKANKAQALKPLEEAAEVFAAWQGGEKDKIVSECADVITATCNLLAAIGVDDMHEAMSECKARNDARGRM
jgi:phosphoribosyl-ATP pyrophosphohydrolase